jgi:hypothetical protein
VGDDEQERGEERIAAHDAGSEERQAGWLATHGRPRRLVDLSSSERS